MIENRTLIARGSRYSNENFDGRATHRRVPHGRTPHRRVLYGRVYASKSKNALGKPSRSPITLQTVFTSFGAKR
jgi:hypothetical protein